MKLNKKATSIVEAMVVMLIIVSGVTGMYKIYTQSERLSTSTTNKIKAIQISRQGIEAFTNIRDTNWLLFSSDYQNCWKTLNYNTSCIGDSTQSYIIAPASYIIYRDTDNKWLLKTKTTGTFGAGTYITDFKVGLINGIYSQTGSLDNLKPAFTREIKVTNTSSDKIEIKSFVQWSDRSSNKPHVVELTQVLTNWKK